MKRLIDVRRIREERDPAEVNRLLARGWWIMTVCAYDDAEPGRPRAENTRYCLGIDTAEDPPEVAGGG